MLTFPVPVLDNPPVFPQLDGIFVLNKSSGPSSAYCLRFFKKLGQKKIGHAGTLDPLASGVLILLLGQATKLSSYLQDGCHKTYRGTLKLGEETDTWDSQGQLLAKKEYAHLKTAEIHSELKAWLEQTEQEVPPFSAAKHNGTALYKLARKSIPTPVKIKTIKISEADILDIRMPYVSFRITCSSGSYIRSLAHSLGKRLGCGAILSDLIREYSHPYSLKEATSPEELAANPALLQERLKSIQSALPNWTVISLKGDQVKAVKNGMPLVAQDVASESSQAILYDAGQPLALAKLIHKDNRQFWTITRGLWN